MRVYDWKSSDTRDIVIIHNTLSEVWGFYAETKSASNYFEQLCGPDLEWASVHSDDGVLYTENKPSFDMLFKIIKETNFVVDLHLGESK
jgi:hypothetical protein